MGSGCTEGWRETQQGEQLAVWGQVGDKIFQTHGEDLVQKKEGVLRLIYENVNGLHSGLLGNKKIEKAQAIHDELKVDIVANNEHHNNFKHEWYNMNLLEIFNGGEAKMRAVVAHNVHKYVSEVRKEVHL